MTLIFSCPSADGIRITLAMSRHNLCLLFRITIIDDVSIVHNEMSVYILYCNYSRVSSCTGATGQTLPVSERCHACSVKFVLVHLFWCICMFDTKTMICKSVHKTQTPVQHSCCASTSCFANVRTMLQHQQGKPDVSLQSHFTVATPSGPLVLRVPCTQSEPSQTSVKNMAILRALLLQLCPFAFNDEQTHTDNVLCVSGVISSIRHTLMVPQ